MAPQPFQVMILALLFLSSFSLGAQILPSSIENFEAPVDQVHFIILIRDDGTTGEWALVQAPACGGLYPVVNGRSMNPCADGDCIDPFVIGNLSTQEGFDDIYMVYYIRSEEITGECAFGSVVNYWIKENELRQTAQVSVTLRPNPNDRPISYGSVVDITVDGSTINLYSNLDDPESEETFFLIPELPRCGTLSNVISANSNVFPNPTLTFTPDSHVYSQGGDPACLFSYTALDEYGRTSPLAFVNIFISYPDPVPLVEDLSINFALRKENLFRPVEIATDAPPPTLYELTELPATTSVYQGTNGMTVGAAITSVPTSIHDVLIFINTGDDDDGLVESFKYKAIDSDGHESEEATVTFTFAYDFDYPRYFRCIINVATGSSTVIDLANSRCVIPVGDSDVHDYTYFIRIPPQKGKVYQWEDSRKTLRIHPEDREVLVLEGSQVLFVNEEEDPTAGYSEITYTASPTDTLYGSPLFGVLVINLVHNTAPFIGAGAVKQTTDEDIPAVVTLTGTDLESAQLTSYINTLPSKGTLFQYEDFADKKKGDLIAANENGFFFVTQVTDRLNRVVFQPGQNENGNPYTSFTYLVNDGNTFSNLGIASLAVTEVPDDPISVNSFYTVQEVSTTIIQLDGYDPDSEDNVFLTFLLLNAPAKGTLYQTNQFDRYDTDEPLIEGFPIQVEDTLGRLMYVAPDVPVEFANGSQYLEQVIFKFQAFVPEQPDRDPPLPDQYSEPSEVIIDILGVNNPPISVSDSVLMEEDSRVLITLNGFDDDPEDQGILQCTIVTVPTNGILSQYFPDWETAIQFDYSITAPGTVVSDPLYRVIYIPDENLVGEKVDVFTFTFSDLRETSFSSEIEISISCINDAPTLAHGEKEIFDQLTFGNLQSGSDTVLYLGGYDPDGADPLGYCEGDLSTFFAVINELPVGESTLYQYIDPDDQGLYDGDLDGLLHSRSHNGEIENTYTDGTVPTKQLRGPIIDSTPTIVTDPLNRVIFAAVFSGDFGTSVSPTSFGVYYEDTSSLKSKIGGSLLTVLFQDYTFILNIVMAPQTSPDIYGESWRTIIPIIGGLLFAAVVFCFLIAILRHMNQEPTNYGLVLEHDIEEFEEDYEELPSDDEEGRYEFIEKPKGLLEGLLLQENLRIVTTLCDIVEVTEFEEVAVALIGVFEFHDMSMMLIKKLITKEVHEASSAGTLFRSNSMASKVMTAFSQKIGPNYLNRTLFTPMNAILEKDVSMEVDRRKLLPGEDRKANMKMLIAACQAMLNWILTSQSNAPPQFKEICKHLFNEVSSRFPHNRHSAVGGFLFLRFFVPAIISPEGHGLFSEAPSVKSRRCFTLIAKALQNLSNGVQFGQKEQYLLDLNEAFIDPNKESVFNFFESMSKVDRYVGRPAEISSDELEECLNIIHRHLFLNQEEMCDILAQKQIRQGSGTGASEVASKMTEGLTTFLHTHSLGDATQLDTSDVSGLTLRTHTLRTHTLRTHRSARSIRTHRSQMGGKSLNGGPEATQWELGARDDDTDYQADDFSFDPSGNSDLGSLGIDSDEIDVVPFDLGEEEITDFDLSSGIPDSETFDDSNESTVLLSGQSSGSRTRRARLSRKSLTRFSTRMTRMSQMTMTGSEMSMMNDRSEYAAKEKKRQRQKSLGRMSGDLASFVDFGGEDEVELEEIDGDGFESEGNGKIEGKSNDLAAQMMTVLQKLGPPPGL